ncbi:MAG: ABC transporter permease [Pseudomonadota bacterium]|nr:ABC transporter permease [Pseudomonadota bacterium]
MQTHEAAAATSASFTARSALRHTLGAGATRIALSLLLGLAVLALAGPWLSRFDSEDTDWEHIQAAPGWAHGHWLGTDAIGRDVFVRTLVGGRVSLLVAAGAGTLALLLGLLYGAYAGTRGGVIERLLMRMLDVISALPFLLIIILLLTVFGRHPLLLIAAIGGYVCVDLARMVRGESARLRELPFMTAARALGASTPWLLYRHVLPNVLGFALVYLSLAIPQAILVESFLSFLGLGVDEPAVSLGTLLAEGAQEIEDAPWVLIAPALFMVSLLIALTVLGDALRRAASPREGDASC